ncbi:MAG: hypothetical protein AAB425_10390, partial [Bdellovibrionota bacterium]
MNAIVFLFGLLPSLIFFVWIERNLALPWLGSTIEWREAGLWHRLGFDAFLFSGFALFHTLLAQENVKSWLLRRTLLGRWLPLERFRAFYLLVTGFSVTVLMMLWQHTGIVVWSAPGSWSWEIVTAISVGLWTAFMGCVGWVIYRQDALVFFGFRPSPGDHFALSTTGVYGLVRHPIYFFTLLSVFVTPFMSLDRLALGIFAILYLLIGVPIEERKLIQIHGSAYSNYRKTVPGWIANPVTVWNQFKWALLKLARLGHASSSNRKRRMGGGGGGEAASVTP